MTTKTELDAAIKWFSTGSHRSEEGQKHMDIIIRAALAPSEEHGYGTPPTASDDCCVPSEAVTTDKKDAEPQGDVGMAIRWAQGQVDKIKNEQDIGTRLLLTEAQIGLETLIAAAQEAAGLAMQLKNSEKIFGRIPFWQIDEEILGQIKRNTEALAAYRGAK